MSKENKKSLEGITLPKVEYELLKVYENDAKEIMKFLAMEHNDIYMDIIINKLSNVEKRMELLREKKRRGE